MKVNRRGYKKRHRENAVNLHSVNRKAGLIKQTKYKSSDVRKRSKENRKRRVENDFQS